MSNMERMESEKKGFINVIWSYKWLISIFFIIAIAFSIIVPKRISPIYKGVGVLAIKEFPDLRFMKTVYVPENVVEISNKSFGKKGGGKKREFWNLVVKSYAKNRNLFLVEFNTYDLKMGPRIVEKNLFFVREKLLSLIKPFIDIELEKTETEIKNSNEKVLLLNYSARFLEEFNKINKGFFNSKLKYDMQDFFNDARKSPLISSWFGMNYQTYVKAQGLMSTKLNLFNEKIKLKNLEMKDKELKEIKNGKFLFWFSKPSCSPNPINRLGIFSNVGSSGVFGILLGILLR